MVIEFDERDRQLLALLQADALLGHAQLGEALALSPSQAGRRRQRLEALGVIDGYGARLAPAQLGLGIQAFVQVSMAAHSPEADDDFRRAVAARDEVVEVWAMTGEADYLLRAWCADLAALNRLVKRVLLPHPAVAKVHSQIVMEQAKRAHALPLPS